jgi:hypothetical protein
LNLAATVDDTHGQAMDGSEMAGTGGERSGPFLSQKPNEPPLAFFFIGGIMARYNINVRTSSHIADTKPVEMDSLDALRVEMALFVGELLKNHADLIWKDHRECIAIRAKYDHTTVSRQKIRTILVL